LSIGEREIIGLMLAQDKSCREIGKAIGRHHTTISREIQINAPPVRKGYYLAHKAQERATERRIETHKRPRLKTEQIRRYTRKMLKKGWSPEQIAGRIAEDSPGQSIGYEAIYQYVYEERPELIQHLARSHRERFPRGHSRKHCRSHIPRRRSLEQRPKEVEERKVIGHWEGDTIVSRQSPAGLQVTTERKSRFVRITKINRKTSSKAMKAVIRQLKDYPLNLRKTLTLDNGSENTEHERITAAIGAQTFFCAPFHSWEKGTVENTNGLIRRFFPKKTDFARISYYEVKKVEQLLNNRPRKCLNYATPQEVLSGAFAGGM
jgi:IS30 family transposase